MDELPRFIYVHVWARFLVREIGNGRIYFCAPIWKYRHKAANRDAVWRVESSDISKEPNYFGHLVIQKATRVAKSKFPLDKVKK